MAATAADYKPGASPRSRPLRDVRLVLASVDSFSVQPPQTQYVERDGISIAYQVVGDGPVDLLISPGFVSHLDLQWADPRIARFLARLASFARLIIYDKPGTGLSDPIAQLPTLEERVADIEAVLDAAGSEQAVLLGISEGGPTSVLLAAMRPQRITSLILFGSFACTPWAAPGDFSAEQLSGWTASRSGARRARALGRWGQADGGLRSERDYDRVAEARVRIFARAAASPRMARALIEIVEQIDIRDVLPSVRVPTLVLHAEGDRVTVRGGRTARGRHPRGPLRQVPGDRPCILARRRARR